MYVILHWTTRVDVTHVAVHSAMCYRRASIFKDMGLITWCGPQCILTEQMFLTLLT